ncbi:MAG: hypothetical protein OXU20_02380, partial [Myxococcales bacterium]|nr:hypothetical protein [Myxococcales bacterium]
TEYDSFDRKFTKGFFDSTVRETNDRDAGVLHATTATEDAYTMELAIPWSSLGITPLSGQTVIGFDIGCNDDDDGIDRDLQLMWHGTRFNYDRTDAFGELFLVL